MSAREEGWALYAAGWAAHPIGMRFPSMIPLHEISSMRGAPSSLIIASMVRRLKRRYAAPSSASIPSYASSRGATLRTALATARSTSGQISPSHDLVVWRPARYSRSLSRRRRCEVAGDWAQRYAVWCMHASGESRCDASYSTAAILAHPSCERPRGRW